MSNDFENMEYCIAHTHEEQMMESGRKRAEKRRNSNVMRNDASVTSSGKSMVSRAIQPMADHIVKFFNESGIKGKPHMAFTFAKEIPPETIAVITAKHIINMMVQRKALTATAISLGEKIETEVALRNFALANRNLYQTVKANLDKRSWNYTYKRRKFRESAIRDAEGNWIKWTTNEKLQIGIRFIDIFIQSTGLVSIGTETVRQKKRKVLNYTKENLEWISKRESYTELLHPDYLPTITPPKDWTTVEGGGYITSVLPDLDLVKVKNKKFKRLYERLICLRYTRQLTTYNVHLSELTKKYWMLHIKYGTRDSDVVRYLRPISLTYLTVHMTLTQTQRPESCGVMWLPLRTR